MDANPFAILLYFFAFFIGFNWWALLRNTSPGNHFFYGQVKHITRKHLNPTNYQLYHWFNLVCYSFYILRFSYILLLQYHPDYSQVEIDYLAHFFKLFSHKRDGFFGLTFIMLLTFCVLLEPLFYFSPINTITWQKYVDLVIINTDLYNANHNQCDSKLPKLMRLTQPAAKLNMATFSLTSLPHFPTLSVRLRIRFAKIVQLMEGASFVAIIWGCLMANLFLGFYYVRFASTIWRNLSVWLFVPIVLDLVLFSYSMIRLISIGLIGLCCANVGTLLYTGHIGDLNQFLVKVSSCHSFQWGNMAKLRLFVSEYTRMCIMLLTVNRELWSRVAFVSIMIHIPSNVYLLYKLLKSYQVAGVQLFLSWGILSIQWFIVLASLLPLAQSSAVFHRSARVMPKIQHLLPTKMLRLKWSYLALYERVNSEQKYGITMGPASAITYRMIYEIFLLYFAFVFKIFDFLL